MRASLPSMPPWRSIVPADVACVELRGKPLPLCALLPEEESSLGLVAQVRRREFAAGRHCARAALALLGIHGVALPIGPKRAPVWPRGGVGSISHTRSFCAAAVGPDSVYAGIGLGVEARGRFTPKLWRQVLVDAEIACLDELGTAERDARATALFCAREAFYKMQFPVTGAWVGFHDVQVHVGHDAFEVELLVDVPRLGRRGKRFGGCLWWHDPDLVFAAMTLRAHG